MINKLLKAYHISLANFKILFRNFYAKFKKKGQVGLSIYDISEFLIMIRKNNPIPDNQKSGIIDQLKELAGKIQVVKFTEVY